jgi:hypothetical protein
MPPGMRHHVLDFGLHADPDSLKATLQAVIDDASEDVDTIILGYGLCSLVVAGLKATRATLVVPCVDDCIAIFLGSREAHEAQHAAEPGTYYLTKGWIEAGDGPCADRGRLVERYGVERTEWLLREMLKHYTRLALINTGQYETERYRRYSRERAERFDLRFEETPGSNELIRRMLHGPRNGDFVTARPGETIPLDAFLQAAWRS